MTAIDNGSCAAIEIPSLHPHQIPLEAQQLSVENQAGKTANCGDKGAPLKDGTGGTDGGLKDGQAGPYAPQEGAHKGLVPRPATPEEDAAIKKALAGMHGDSAALNDPKLQQKLNEIVNHTLAKDQPPLPWQKSSRSDLPDRYDDVVKFDPLTGKSTGYEEVNKDFPQLAKYNERVKNEVHEDQEFNDKARDHWNKMSPAEQDKVKAQYKQYQDAQENVRKNGTYTVEPWIEPGPELKQYMKDMKQMHDDAHKHAQQQKKQIAKDLGPAFERDVKSWNSDGGQP